jgi:diphthine-ammonia ligase
MEAAKYRTGCSWSGGKDSCYALIKAAQAGYLPTVLLNVLNEHGNVSRSHGIPRNVLLAQAEAASIPIKLIASSWTDYEPRFIDALKQLKYAYAIDHMVFGDIDLEAHREWEEKVCAAVNLRPLLPLWKQDRKELVLEMLSIGIETMIISCNEKMGKGFLGRILDLALIQELESRDIDVCGENGEFHTLVLNCPLFKQRLHVDVERIFQHNDYWFCEVTLR